MDNKITVYQHETSVQSNDVEPEKYKPDLVAQHHASRHPKQAHRLHTPDGSILLANAILTWYITANIDSNTSSHSNQLHNTNTRVKLRLKKTQTTKHIRSIQLDP